MKIIAPGLKLDMILSDIVLRDERPVIICRMGAYDATTELSREDIITFLKCMLRPKMFFAVARLLLLRSKKVP